MQKGDIHALTGASTIGAPAIGEGPATCRRCTLWKNATQAVLGEGGPHPKIMLVGEQPGNEEDLSGHPFVGPAGRLLDDAVGQAGLNRAELFVTNAVKHFKWEPRGKRRLHKKPAVGEINACHIWLAQEIASERPAVILALGATALRALTGKSLSIESARRTTLHYGADIRVLATYHPSAILRAQGERVDALRSLLIRDLKTAAKIAARAA